VANSTRRFFSSRYSGVAAAFSDNTRNSFRGRPSTVQLPWIKLSRQMTYGMVLRSSPRSQLRPWGGSQFMFTVVGGWAKICPERNSLGRGHTAWLLGALHGLSWGRGQLFLWRWNWGLLLSYFFFVVFFTVLVISLKLSKASDERLMSIGLWSAECPLATTLWCVLTSYCPMTAINVDHCWWCLHYMQQWTKVCLHQSSPWSSCLCPSPSRSPQPLFANILQIPVDFFSRQQSLTLNERSDWFFSQHQTGAGRSQTWNNSTSNPSGLSIGAPMASDSLLDLGNASRGSL